MVLESQTLRHAGPMRSRRRRHAKPWRLPAALLVVAGVGTAAYLMIDGADANGDQPGGQHPAHNATPDTPPTGGQALVANRPADAQPDRQRPAPALSAPAPAAARHGDATPKDPPPTPAPDAPSFAPATPTSNTVARKIAQGRELVREGKDVLGRSVLNEALNGPISRDDAADVRRDIARVNQTLIFSPRITDADPYAGEHIMQPGQILARVAPRYHVPWQFIARINNIPDTRRIRAGQRLKVVNGPFHVTVHKSDFRADVYLNGDNERLYVRSFTVGLGEFDSTPVGRFVVKTGSKLVNPEWTNPRTGERMLADDPDNPIGEHWIGLRGADEATQRFQRYGLHGTIEPESIGQQASMGCIRLRPDDIALLYAMLLEGKSTVTIVR